MHFEDEKLHLSAMDYLLLYPQLLHYIIKSEPICLMRKPKHRTICDMEKGNRNKMTVKEKNVTGKYSHLKFLNIRNQLNVWEICLFLCTLFLQKSKLQIFTFMHLSNAFVENIPIWGT